MVLFSQCPGSTKIFKIVMKKNIHNNRCLKLGLKNEDFFRYKRKGMTDFFGGGGTGGGGLAFNHQVLPRRQDDE